MTRKKQTPIKVDNDVVEELNRLKTAAGVSRPKLIRELAARYGEQVVDQLRVPLPKETEGAEKVHT
jgi:hypothetical protein